VGWGKKILGNGYTMLVATLGLFTVMHLGLPDEGFHCLPAISSAPVAHMGARPSIVCLPDKGCNGSATGLLDLPHPASPGA